MTPDWEILPATRSGFVRMIDVERLVAAAAEADTIVRVLARPGDHVVQGTPLAALAPAGSRPPSELVDAVHAAVVLGYERTVEQDAAYGFRQLTDIAVKALSPGINDPVTATHCMGHMADLLVELTSRRLGPTLHEDAAGAERAVVEDRDLRYYLDLGCGQIRRYGRREPTVLVAVLRMLRDLASSARDDEQREEIRRQVDLVLASVPGEYLDDERAEVETVATQVGRALAGDTLEAFVDRAGETRSI